jgi:NADH-quinone oxidoreductase subunit E/NADP-reducing hydrogenase subunit HndA
MPSGVRGELLSSLKRAQAEHRQLSREVMEEISRSLEIPLGDVFGVASFYSFLSTEPRGRNTIMICRSVPCYLKHSEMIVEAVGDEIGIGVGETTDDGRFSFESTNCIGACDAAPAMLVNADVHGDLTSRKISRILKSYR